MQALCARCVTLSLKWMVRTIALDILFQLFLTKALVTIKCNTTDGIISYNQPIELTCNAPNIPNPMYKWTSTKLKEPHKGASVAVIANNDSVEYNCTATSVDGVEQHGSIYVFSVNDDICLSTVIPEVVQGSSNKTSVEGRVVTFSCDFKGHYSVLNNYGFQWMVIFQDGTLNKVEENSSNSDYYIYTRLIFRDCHCYYFRTELYVLAIRSLDNARITCTTDYKTTANPSYLRTIELPRLIIGPTDAIDVKEHDSVKFECCFSASLVPNLAICEWLKDGDPASNENKHQTTDSKSNIICSYNINSVSSLAEGKYACYIYYNKSFENQFNLPKDEIIKSKSGEAVLQIAEGHVDTLGIIGTVVVVVGVIAVTLSLFFLCNGCKKNAERGDDGTPLLRARSVQVTTADRTHPQPSYGVVFSIRFVTHPKAENIVLTGNRLELSCKADGTPGITLEYHWFKCERDGSQEKSTGHSSNKMIIPKCSNVDEGYYVCETTACSCEQWKGMVRSAVAHVKVVDSSNINIVKQPPSEVDIKLGEELTLECQALCGSYSVKYQWCKGSDQLAGATQPVLTISPVSETDIGPYNCIITSDFSVEKAVSKTTEVKIKPLEKEQLPLPTEKEDDKATAAHDQLHRTIPSNNPTPQANKAQNVEVNVITAEVYDTIHRQPPCVDDTSSNESYEDAIERRTSEEELLSSADEDDTSSNESYEDAIDRRTIYGQDSEGSKEELLSPAEEGQVVDCADANKYIRSEYVGLSRINISDGVLGHLYAMKVITHDEQKHMERLGIEKRMKFLLDNVIIPSLLSGHSEKYINLIHVMECSEDTSLNAQASKLKHYVHHR